MYIVYIYDTRLTVTCLANNKTCNISFGNVAHPFFFSFRRIVVFYFVLKTVFPLTCTACRYLYISDEESCCLKGRTGGIRFYASNKLVRWSSSRAAVRSLLAVVLVITKEDEKKITHYFINHWLPPRARFIYYGCIIISQQYIITIITIVIFCYINL